MDRASNSDIKVISANLNSIQSTFDNANNGYNPLGIPNGDSVMMDFDPTFTEVGSGFREKYTLIKCIRGQRQQSKMLSQYGKVLMSQEHDQTG